MATPDLVQSALFEHRFWLQIMGDHAWWLRVTLVDPPDQFVAQGFLTSYDRLLCRAREPLAAADVQSLSLQARGLTLQFRAFKLGLLRRYDLAQLQINLKPTTINHMVNELDEYLCILNHLAFGQPVPLFTPLHYHNLWLIQVEGHANTVADELDPVEKDYVNAARCYSKQGADLLRKSQELAGHTRSGLCVFPALTRLDVQVETMVTPFTAFLDDVGSKRLNSTLLGNLPALIPEHYSREQCYYLSKLADIADRPRPDCNPGRQGYRLPAC